MSVACRECGQVGAFVSHIVYGYKGGGVENYPNFYIHDRHLIGVEEDEEGISPYYIVEYDIPREVWNSPNSYEVVNIIQVKEEWIAENCPNTYKAMKDLIMNKISS